MTFSIVAKEIKPKEEKRREEERVDEEIKYKQLGEISGEIK